ncbi:polysaccharide pyruvyl transferase family protein [Cellulomonas sp. CW35]|uniref:polysaccharide pyruvyl transferase family protein n=1 Tax=Cellulomonas sp. CW35 TaxID=3458249 RepID=UPI0040349E73
MDEAGDYLRRVGGVHAFQWNPLREIDGEPQLLNNFGDLLGPIVVELVLESIAPGTRLERAPERRVLSVGSVMHFARPRDVVWGTGINGKVSNASVHGERELDVRAVRGPLSAAYLSARGIEVPDVYGDPAMLLPTLMPELWQWARRRVTDVLVAPNLNDLGSEAAWPVDPEAGQRLLVPTDPVRSVLRTIAQSRFVVGSSLHAVILADALGIPARFVASANESVFKYRDYLAGTGRPLTRIADSVAHALELGPHEPPVVDLERLLAAFPRDVWALGSPLTGWAGRPFGVARFGRVVTSDLLRTTRGEVSDDDLRARWLDQLVPRAVAAVTGQEVGPLVLESTDRRESAVTDADEPEERVDGTPEDETREDGTPAHEAPADDAAEDPLELAATYRELVVPGLDTTVLEDEQRDRAELVQHRDAARLAVAARLHGRPPTAELRAQRPASGGWVLSFTVQVPHVRGGIDELALVLRAQGSHARVLVPVPRSPFHVRQWHLDVDVMVPRHALDSTSAAEPGTERWDVHVLLVEGTGARSEVPLAPRGSLGLVLSGSGGQSPPPTAWTLVVDPTAVPA